MYVFIGKAVVEKIFPNFNPVGQTVRVDGRPLRVIGVMEKQPEMFGREQR